MGKKVTGPWKLICQRPSGELTSERPFRTKEEAVKIRSKMLKHLKEWNPNGLILFIKRGPLDPERVQRDIEAWLDKFRALVAQ